MMNNRQPLEVPPGVRYLSDWKNLWDEFPEEHFILNKRLTNVGATFYFLENEHKVILCSPRCSLLENKREKHKNAWIYRMMSDAAVSDTDTTKKAKAKKTDYDDIKRYNADVITYLNTCAVKGIVPKLMTTYDSLGHIIDVLRSISETELSQWTLVIDEFACIFADSAYKATTELTFLYNAQFFKRAIFLSATPYLEKYMEQMPQFKDILYMELKWPDDMITNANVTNITLGKRESIPGTCKKIIDCMRAGKTVKFGSKEIDTTEAVFYINKVSTIRDIIKKCNLKPSEVNVLCAKSDDNDKRLKEVGHVRGTFPKSGEPNKMFTFMTRSNFLGVDLESTCAYTYVFADPSQQTLALDVSTDLVQVLGRQRLSENPYQHEAILFMKNNSVGLDEEAFTKYIEEKTNATNILIDNYNKADDATQKVLLKTYRRAAERDHFRDNYLCVRDDKQSGKPVVEFNMLVMLSEIRAWDIRKNKYKDPYQVIDEQKDAGISGSLGITSDNPDVIAFKERFDNCKTSTDHMKEYAEFRNNYPQLAKETGFVAHRYTTYWDALGYANLRKLGFQESRIKNALAAPTPFDNTLDNVILDIRATMSEAKYQMKEAKEKLTKIYNKEGLSKAAVAKDLGMYVTAKPYQDGKTGKKYIQILSLYQKSITLFPFVWRPNVPITKGMTIDRFLDIIETGKYKISKSATESRNLKDVVNEISSLPDHDKQNELKEQWLPVACINGVFKYKNDHGLEVYSSFLALDYDDFESEEQMNEAIEKLKTFAFVYAIFVTPSGKGIKAIVMHDSTNPMFHHNLYTQVARICELPQEDDSVSDLSRGQFLSYDPKVWRNPAPVPFHFEYDSSIEVKKETKEKAVVSNIKGSESVVKLDTWESEFLHNLWQNILTDDAILERLDKYWTTKKQEYFKVGNRHVSMLVISGTLCKAGIPQEKTEKYLKESYLNMPGEEIDSIIDYAYERNAFGCDRRLYK